MKSILAKKRVATGQQPAHRRASLHRATLLNKAQWPLSTLTTAGLGVVFGWIYSNLLFVLLMARERMFSYDFFAEGGFGMAVFYLTAELAIVVISLAVWGAVMVGLRVLQRRRAGLETTSTEELLILAVGVLGTALSAGLLAPAVIDPETRPGAISMLVLLAGVAAFIHVVYILDVGPRVVRFFLAATLLVLATVLFRDRFAEALQVGLRAYGVGGGVPVTLYLQEAGDKNQIEGTLILLSPRTVAFRTQGNSATQYINRDELRRLEVAQIPRRSR